MKVKNMILKVVLVIIILMVLLIPIFLFLNNEGKNKNYDELINDIKTSAEKYIAHNDVKDISKIKISVLKRASLLNNALVNSKTKRPISNESYVSLNSDSSIGEIILYDIPTNENEADLVISFNGDKYIKNGISTRYQELGINVSDGTNELDYSIQYFVKGKEITNIDVYKPRDYEVVYTAVSPKGELAKVIRTVVVQ